MLAPLLLLWPMSVALTWLVAQNIANRPYDRELGEMVRALAQQVSVEPAGGDGLPTVRLRMPAMAAELLRADEADSVYYQVLGARGEFLAGDRGLPVPRRGGRPARRAALPRRRRCATTRCAWPTCGWRCPAPPATAAHAGAGGRDAGQALAPGHRDHQGRDPAAVRDPAAGGAAGVVRAGARHHAAEPSCSSASASARAPT